MGPRSSLFKRLAWTSESITLRLYVELPDTVSNHTQILPTDHMVDRDRFKSMKQAESRRRTVVRALPSKRPYRDCIEPFSLSMTDGRAKWRLDIQSIDRMANERCQYPGLTFNAAKALSAKVSPHSPVHAGLDNMSTILRDTRQTGRHGCNLQQNNGLCQAGRVECARRTSCTIAVSP